MEEENEKENYGEYVDRREREKDVTWIRRREKMKEPWCGLVFFVVFSTCKRGGDTFCTWGGYVEIWRKSGLGGKIWAVAGP